MPNQKNQNYELSALRRQLAYASHRLASGQFRSFVVARAQYRVLLNAVEQVSKDSVGNVHP